MPELLRKSCNQIGRILGYSDAASWHKICFWKGNIHAGIAKGSKILRHAEIFDLVKQWQLAAIWMRDANMHGRPRRALMNETTSRDIAGKFLDDYFDMVEQILHQSSAAAPSQNAQATATRSRELKS